MKFGVREICNVVLKAKAAMKVGDKIFYKNEPVCYFDSLKTSTMEGASTTVYAQGGRGNARLVAWEGERTVTFTMEDALISPIGFSILTGAGLIRGSDNKKIITHVTEQTDNVALKTSAGANYTGATGQTLDYVEVKVTNNPYVGNSIVEESSTSSESATFKADNDQDYIYVMLLDDHGEVVSEPYIGSEVNVKSDGTADNGATTYTVRIYATDSGRSDINTILPGAENNPTTNTRYNDLSKFVNGSVVLVDYYTAREEEAFQVDITPDRFGGNFYLEAETLFRDTNGVDMPAEFIIPNCKVQSNFTFTMASSGDPSTFTFTMDAFPDYTRWNKTKKVFAAIQVIESGTITADLERLGTKHDYAPSNQTNAYNTNHKPIIEEIY